MINGPRQGQHTVLDCLDCAKFVRQRTGIGPPRDKKGSQPIFPHIKLGAHALICRLCMPAAERGGKNSQGLNNFHLQNVEFQVQTPDMALKYAPNLSIAVCNMTGVPRS